MGCTSSAAGISIVWLCLMVCVFCFLFFCLKCWNKCVVSIFICSFLCMFCDLLCELVRVFFGWGGGGIVCLFCLFCLVFEIFQLAPFWVLICRQACCSYCPILCCYCTRYAVRSWYDIFISHKKFVSVLSQIICCGTAPWIDTIQVMLYSDWLSVIL